MSEVAVNGQHYPSPLKRTVVIGFDGCDPAYVDWGLANDTLTTIAQLKAARFLGTGSTFAPTFADHNIASIATDEPPAVQGKSGNNEFDRATGKTHSTCTRDAA